MLNRKILAHVLLLVLAGLLGPGTTVRAEPAPDAAARPASVSAYDLILAMNQLRVSFGHPALVEHPIINAVAQSTAQTMAANNMSWHIGNVRGRIQAAGYGGGATVWATENFAVGTSMGLDQIMVAWADPDHMRPAVNAAYCHVGAGVAQAANGKIYYVLQAAYVAGSACGDITSTGPTGGTTGGTSPFFGIIEPVTIATPDVEGNVHHFVKTGQSLWSIAIAYQVTIADIEFWNNISREQSLRVGQRLFIPSPNTQGYATATPVGMVVRSPPNEEGKVVHTVEAYQTLSTIAKAYEVTVTNILNLNGIQIDWPLRIGQELLVDPGVVLSPIERLTPDVDGRYFHTVQNGETLSGIAGQYEITLNSLLSSNSLAANSIIQPGQDLFLPVTPPATATYTAAPPSATPITPATSTPRPSQPSATRTPPAAAASPTPPAEPASSPLDLIDGWPLPVALIALGLLIMVWVARRNQS